MQEEDHRLSNNACEHQHRINLWRRREHLNVVVDHLVQPLMSGPEPFEDSHVAAHVDLLGRDLLSVGKGATADRRENDTLTERGDGLSSVGAGLHHHFGKVLRCDRLAGLKLFLWAGQTGNNLHMLVLV